MNQPEHINTIQNSLKNNQKVEVFILENGNRKNGLQNGNSTLSPGPIENLAAVNVNKDFSLIIQSEMVPNRGNNKPEGIKIEFRSESKPVHVEVRSPRGNRINYEYEFHFKGLKPHKADKKPDVITHIDANIHHPEGDDQ